MALVKQMPKTTSLRLFMSQPSIDKWELLLQAVAALVFMFGNAQKINSCVAKCFFTTCIWWERSNWGYNCYKEAKTHLLVSQPSNLLCRPQMLFIALEYWICALFKEYGTFAMIFYFLFFFIICFLMQN